MKTILLHHQILISCLRKSPGEYFEIKIINNEESLEIERRNENNVGFH